jgi:hypothetical protein
MPQQDTTKQRREQAIKKTKQRREQLLQPKQQQQQPARDTQPNNRNRNQPARQPTVILPDYTERAKKLGELIALYLKG